MASANKVTFQIQFW